jgi:hypothetical protein
MAVRTYGGGGGRSGRSAVEGNFANTRAGNLATRGGAVSQVQELARQLANDIVRQRDAQTSPIRTGRIYTLFNPTDDILSNNVSTVTTGLFSGNTGSLVTMFTQSGQTAAQNSYFQTVFNELSTSDTAAPQFSIAYGHFDGSGSKDTTGNLNNDTPSRAIYKQYAQLLLPPNDLKFTFDGVDSNQIYVLNFERARIREKIDPGNLEINLAELSGSLFNKHTIHPNAFTGSNVKLSGTGTVVSLIDDSSTQAGTVGESGKVYNIVSGSIDQGTTIFNSSDPVVYGKLFPENGIAILNGDKLDEVVGFGSVTGSTIQGDNYMKLFTALSSSQGLAPSGRNFGLQARSSEQVKSSFYFVRVKNGEYNYSNNPSYVTGSLGELRYSTFVNDPQAYITTIGLYNNNRELLAVAKLSQPLLKNKTKEVLVKVKLDF